MYKFENKSSCVRIFLFYMLSVIDSYGVEEEYSLERLVKSDVKICVEEDKSKCILSTLERAASEECKYWILAHKKYCRKKDALRSARLLYQTKKYVSTKEFTSQLKGHYQNFLERKKKQAEKNSTKKTLYIFYTPRKSSDWLVSLLYPNLSEEERSIVEIEKDNLVIKFKKIEDLENISKLKPFFSSITDSNVEFIVLDDMAYSGNQITETINDLTKSYDGDKRIPLSVIVPYISTYATKKIKGLTDKEALIDVALYEEGQTKILTLSDLLTENILNGNDSNSDDRIKEYFKLYIEDGLYNDDYKRLTNIHFEHKTADNLSVPTHFLERGEVRCGGVEDNELTTPDELIVLNNRNSGRKRWKAQFRCVEPVIPPYKVKVGEKLDDIYTLPINSNNFLCGGQIKDILTEEAYHNLDKLLGFDGNCTTFENSMKKIKEDIRNDFPQCF
ncbi:hypothetical protein OAB57_00310 [Bacteriovoracaceae bacterium]|nr:hypothetical protein [Bacteriovoracaceae bacterium]